MPELMSTAELAAFLGVPKGTLANWRYHGRGPAGFRVGRHVRYLRTDVEAWIDDQRNAETARVAREADDSRRGVA